MSRGQNLKSALIGTRLEAPLYKARWLLGFLEKRQELWELHLDEMRMRRVLERLLSVDSCCVDVGAHIGSVLSLFTRIAPQGQHIAIEPLKEKADRLIRNFPGADVFTAAVSDTNGTATFETDKHLSGFSHLQRSAIDPKATTLQVQTRRLDDLIGNRPVALIKLDVEGFELAALRGAVDLISRSRPAIIFECGNDRDDRKELYDFLTSLDYQIFLFSDFLYDRGPMQFDEFRRCGLYPFRAFNFLALPNVR